MEIDELLTGIDKASKVATALKKPKGTVILKLEDLDPVDKIREPVFYEHVKQSFLNHGLFHPLVIRKVTKAEWREEMVLDKDMLPPPPDGPEERLLIQCGCNRYYMLKELGYEAVECILLDNKEEACELCRRMRIDKRWHRWGSYTADELERWNI